MFASLEYCHNQSSRYRLFRRIPSKSSAIDDDHYGGNHNVVLTSHAKNYDPEAEEV
jgi:hypothetical protein